MNSPMRHVVSLCLLFASAAVTASAGRQVAAQHGLVSHESAGLTKYARIWSSPRPRFCQTRNHSVSWPDCSTGLVFNASFSRPARIPGSGPGRAMAAPGAQSAFATTSSIQ